MRLYIAEKPSVAKVIAAELGIAGRAEGYIDCGPAGRVTWCFGHMLEQAEPDVYLPDTVPVSEKTGKKVWRAEDLPIIPTQWRSEPIAKTKAQLAIIGKLLQDAHEVVNAGDPDREGQLLVDEVLAHFHCTKPTLRYWVNAQDATSVQRGLAALKNNADYAGFAEAARQRGRADWLIGMNLSRAYTLRARRGGSQALLPIGRVQTPTLGLVVARDREIESFKAVGYQTISAAIQHANGTFHAAWKARDDQPGLDAEGRLIDTAVAKAIVQAMAGCAGSISRYEQEPKTQPQPRAWSLSDITLVASNRYGYSAEEVLVACQGLYETYKLTSYPRTDCDYLPEVQHADAPRVLAALRKVNPDLAAQIDGADPRIRSATWNDKKVTAHHGIVPTMHVGDMSGLTPAEKHVYALIVRAYLAQFYPVHQYQQTNVEATFNAETAAATGRVVTTPGWKVLYASDEDADDASAPAEAKAPEQQRLPAMKTDDAATCVNVERKDAKTKAPARFTEGTLGKAMENVHRYVADSAHRKMLQERDGIGTDATRASIIAELRRRNFLEAKGRYVQSSQFGRGLIDAVPEVIKSPVLTAIYERMLKSIQNGEGDAAAFLAAQEQFVRDQVAKANDGSVQIAGSGAAPCPKCGKGMRRIKGANGFFWACADREGCRNTMSDKAGKPLTKEAARVSTLHKCMACGAGLVARNGPKKPWEKVAHRWWGCSAFPVCRQRYADRGGKPDYDSSATPGASTNHPSPTTTQEPS